MLNGFQKFLVFINNNWTLIVVVFSVIYVITKKLLSCSANSTEKKIEIAKAQIKEIILNLVYDAEISFEFWNKAGAIKRSQVIQKIFKDYPILSKITDQKNVINWIDKIIDASLIEVRNVLDKNKTN